METLRVERSEVMLVVSNDTACRIRCNKSVSLKVVSEHLQAKSTLSHNAGVHTQVHGDHYITH